MKLAFLLLLVGCRSHVPRAPFPREVNGVKVVWAVRLHNRETGKAVSDYVIWYADGSEGHGRVPESEVFDIYGAFENDCFDWARVKKG